MDIDSLLVKGGEYEQKNYEPEFNCCPPTTAPFDWFSIPSVYKYDVSDLSSATSTLYPAI